MSQEKSIADEFYTLILKDILPDIAKAAGSLQNDLKYVDSKTACKLYEEKMEEMKQMVNCYIEGQVITHGKMIGRGVA